jgi:hypothetical protein
VRLQGESIKPTVHPQIVVTEPPQPARHAIAQWVGEADAHLLAPRDEVVEWLAKLIPEYIRSEQNAAATAPQALTMNLAPTA